MMEKGFFARVFVGLALLAASGMVVAAEIRDVRIAATETGTRVVLDLSAPVNYNAFLLEDPGRVVLDLSRSSLKSKLPAGEAPVTEVRSGKLPNGGLRLVFEVK